jgi:hypothetical protein
MAQVKGTRSLAELPTPPGLPLLGQSIQIVRYGVEHVSFLSSYLKKKLKPSGSHVCTPTRLRTCARLANPYLRVLLPMSTSLQFTAARLIFASALDVTRYQY